MRAGWPARTMSRSPLGSASSPNSGVTAYQSPARKSTGFDPMGVWTSVSTLIGFVSVPGVTCRLTVAALVNVWVVALDSRWSSRFWRVSDIVAPDSAADISNAPTAKAMVMRVRSPTRGRTAQRRFMRPLLRPRPSGLELVPEPPDGDDVSGVPGVALDLGAQPAHVDVDEPTVAEVPVSPHPLEQHLAAEDAAGARCQLHEQAELRLRQVHLLTGPAHDTLVGDDLQVAEAEWGAARVGAADAAEQRPDAGGQLLGCEGLGEVVVGARLETRDHVVGVGACGDHDDRDIGRAPDRPAHLEPVDARQHDVDQHDVARLALEGGQGLLTGVGLLDRPALVLQCELHRRADPLVVLD